MEPTKIYIPAKAAGKLADPTSMGEVKTTVHSFPTKGSALPYRQIVWKNALTAIPREGEQVIFRSNDDNLLHLLDTVHEAVCNLRQWQSLVRTLNMHSWLYAKEIL